MQRVLRYCLLVVAVFIVYHISASLSCVKAQVPITNPNRGQVLITEFRLQGPNGTTDEFIEIYNNTDSDIKVADAKIVGVGCGVAQPPGWAIVEFTDVNNPVAIIPVDVIIPARGHYLVANNLSYSLNDYGESGAASPNRTYVKDLSEYSGFALFKTTDCSEFNGSTYILDAVGSEGVDAFRDPNPIFREGTGLFPLASTSEEYSWVRKFNIATGLPQDTDNNAADFTLISTTANAFQSQFLNFIPPDTRTKDAELGAPGPENLTSPIRKELAGSPSITASTPSGCTLTFRDPNAIGTNANSGTLAIRRRYTNNTGFNLTKLRFRVIDITTTNSRAIFIPTQADLRLLSSSGGTPCGADAFRVITLEDPPTQGLGGGRNSTVAVGTITLAAPLANGDSINVEFLLGVVTAGTYRFVVIIEATQPMI